MFTTFVEKAISLADKKDKPKKDSSTLPEIAPNFTFPGSEGLTTIIGYVLGFGTLTLLISVVIAGILIGFKGFGSQRVQQSATSAFGWVILGLLVVGGASAFWKWGLNFDLGII